MKILICAATATEIEKVQKLLSINYPPVEFLITGVGTPFTMYRLLSHLQNSKPQLVINIGIAGAYSKDLKIGHVYLVQSDSFADLGIETQDNFIHLSETKMWTEHDIFNKNKIICENSYFEHFSKYYQTINALTFNTCHGNQTSINQLLKNYSADIETMEGAAIAYICKKQKIPYLQIRSISNYVEQRDVNKWNIPLAIENLTNEIIHIMDELIHS
ncbi:MAG: futalosine hydrolase [Bacteroidales bacterium]